MSILDPKKVKERLSVLKSQRSLWENHWQEIADFMLPNKAIITVKDTPGGKRNTHLYDNTAIQALELLAGALHGMLTNPYSQWFELQTGDPTLDDRDDVRLWLQDTTRRMHNILNDSNFQTEIHEYYLDLCGFGTAPLLIEEDSDSVVRFMAVFIGNLYICEDDKGVVNEVYRNFEYTARQIIEKFGTDGLSDKVLSANKTDADQKFKLIHAVYPNKDINAVGSTNSFKFVSQYVLEIDDSQIEVKGFNEMPFIIGRWSKTSDEVYGRSPGMTALPEAKTINKMTEMSLYAAAKTLDPPLQLPDDGFIVPLKTMPGGINYYRAGTQDRVEAIFNKEIRIDWADSIQEKHRQRIREAFYVDQLQLNVGPQMTATEVSTRTDEKNRLLGPMVGRQQSELLDRMIMRVYGAGTRKNMFKPPPPMVKTFGVKYSSSIARMQRSSESENIMKTVQAVAPFVQADPTVMDNVDGDESFREIARINGFPQKMIRDQDKVKGIRDSRAKAQQQALQQQNELQNSEKINNVAPVLK